MSRYVVELNDTSGASTTTGSLVASNATLLRRFKIYDIMMGSEASPTDSVNLWQVARITAAGTSTGVTPALLDLADGAALTVCGENHSGEPTYTAGLVMLSIPLNTRATFRWVAAPGGELVGPATNAAGFGVKTPTASSTAVTTTIFFEE
jgi:hypothetical protein